MFYTGIPAYNFIPTFDQYKDMKNKGKVIEIFNSKNMVIPDYLKDDSTVIIIQKQLQGYQ
jgi:ethanolamine transporter EutH